MRKYVSFALLALVLTSCGGSQKLYDWGDYDKSSYRYLKNADEESKQELLEDYQEIIDKQKGTRQTVPPGICADYGYLLLQKGEVAKGKEMLKKEVALYPESKIFVSRILKMVEE